MTRSKFKWSATDTKNFIADLLDDLVDEGAVLFNLSGDSHIGALPTGRAVLFVVQQAKKVKEKDEIDEDGNDVFYWEPKREVTKKTFEYMDKLARANTLVFEVLVPTWAPEDDDEFIQAARFIPEPESDHDEDEDEEDDEDDAEPFIPYASAEELMEELLAIDFDERGKAPDEHPTMTSSGDGVDIGTERHRVRLEAGQVTLGGTGRGMQGALKLKIDNPLYQQAFDVVSGMMKKKP